MTESLNHYAVLGISAHATPREITLAFKKKLAGFPEKARDPINNVEFRKLIISYQVLTDQERRSAYDQSLGAHVVTRPKALNVRLFASQTTLAAINEDQVLYLLVDIGANSAEAWTKPAVNLCLVIDRSTSMAGNRINQVKEAAAHIVDELKEQDSFSLVAFSDRAEVLIPAGPVKNKGFLRSKISQMFTGGATEILQGIQAGLFELYKAKANSEVSHLILLTDGRTYGDESDSIELMKKAAADGIGLSALGIGSEWNDEFLDELVAPSGGSCAYLDYPEQIVGFLQQRLQALNRAFAQDVKLLLDLPPRIEMRSIHRLGPSPGPIAYSERLAMLGALQYNVPISVLVELVVQPHPPAASTRLQVGVSANVIPGGPSTQRFMDQLSLGFTLDPPQGSLLPAVVRAVNKLNLYQMNERAWQEAERGEVEQASRRMERLATHLLKAGQEQLAQAALAEAGNIARSGRLSQKGRKELKYGTRALLGS